MYKKLSVLLIGIFCIPLFLSSCKKQIETDKEETFLESFSLVSKNQKTYNGLISLNKIKIGGIEFGKDVVDVNYTLGKDATISPNPKDFINSWPERVTFEVTSKSGKTEDYEVILTNYKGEREEAHKTLVVGYIVADDYQYNQLFSTLDFSSLTHVIPSFGLVCSDGSLDTHCLDAHIAEIRDKAHASGVKVLYSIASASKGQFVTAVRTEETREKLATNLVNYAKRNNLDGIDVDFEEYDQLSGSRSNLLDLFKKVREKAGEDLIFTTSMMPGRWLNYTAEWVEYFDFVNLMIYDNISYSRPDLPSQHASYEFFLESIESCMERYKIPADKLVAGVPFYGYEYKDNKIIDIRFNTIVDRYNRSEQSINEDNVDGIYYNGKKTIKRKTQYVLDNKLGGVMIWQLFQDAVKPQDRLMGAIEEVIDNYNK